MQKQAKYGIKSGIVEIFVVVVEDGVGKVESFAGFAVVGVDAQGSEVISDRGGAVAGSEMTDSTEGQCIGIRGIRGNVGV